MHSCVEFVQIKIQNVITLLNRKAITIYKVYIMKNGVLSNVLSFTLKWSTLSYVPDYVHIHIHNIYFR